jgi:amino acid adenylation domain-containing protein
MSGFSKTKDEHRSQHQMIQSRCFHPSNVFVEFGKEEVEQSVPYRFEQQVSKCPGQIAVKTGNKELTYDALNRASNRVARAILAQHGEAEEPIALLLGNGISMITSILAVLKTGKICVPIDPQYPTSRIAHMLADSQAGLIVTNPKYLSSARELAQDKCQLINIDKNQTNHSTKNLGLSKLPDISASIIYTSGSTGEPKGIVHSHRSLLHTTLNYTNAFHICQEDRLILLHSCSFSAGICDIFSCLLNGATLYPWDVKEEGLTGLAHWLMQEQITICHWIPTPFRHFADTLTGKERFPHLRLIILGSETVSKQDIELYKKHFSPNCILVNRLGTSETTIFRHYFIDQETQVNDIVPIGYAVENKEVLLLDENKNEVGFNSVGEIAVRSQYIALGYWRKPELTYAAFLPDPDGGGKRIYLTGNLGRMRPDG